MNETLKAVVRVLEEGQAELKVAASQILGELAPQDPEVVQALRSQLTLGDNTLNRFILQALAKIGTGEAIEILVMRMRDGGGTADLVRHLLSSIGGAVADTLAASYPDATPELRSRILGILGNYSVAGALDVLVQATLGDNESLSKEACQFLLERLQEVSEADRKRYREKVFKELKASKHLTPAALAHGLRVLASVSVAQSRPTLLKFAQPANPPVVRQAALLGLEKASLTSIQSESLLAYLDDSDVTHVVKPTLVALHHHTDWSRPSITKLRSLLSSRREPMKLFALRALQEILSLLLVRDQ